MRAAVARDFGDASVLGWDANRPVPMRKKDQLLLRVEACSIAAGDKHILKGALSALMRPKFPFVPGADVCGIVEDADPASSFKKGERVTASFTGMPEGGMAEFTVVSESQAVRVPKDMSSVDAAALLTSPTTALDAARTAKLKPGARVLVIGGSGGVGSALVQVLRAQGASFVASVSSDDELMADLGVDRNVNYKKEHFWDVPEFKNTPFDAIFDCAGGPTHWVQTRKHGLLPTGWKGGKFVAVIGDSTEFKIDKKYKLIGLAAGMLWRPMWTSLVPWFVPSYKMVVSENSGEKTAQVIRMVERGELRPVVEKRGPFAFSEDGVRSAFEVLLSGHAHGKVVVDMSKSQ